MQNKWSLNSRIGKSISHLFEIGGRTLDAAEAAAEGTVGREKLAKEEAELELAEERTREK